MTLEQLISDMDEKRVELGLLSRNLDYLVGLKRLKFEMKNTHKNGEPSIKSHVNGVSVLVSGNSLMLWIVDEIERMECIMGINEKTEYTDL